VVIYRRTIVLVQHLVSSLSLGGRSVHRLREDLFILIYLLHSSTCFDHYYAHLQDDSCINTGSGMVTTCVLNGHLKRVTIPEAVLIQMSS